MTVPDWVKPTIAVDLLHVHVSRETYESLCDRLSALIESHHAAAFTETFGEVPR